MNQLRYYPHLNTLTGGINSTLLLLQLEYWFERTDGKPFFKFLEPCQDSHYKGGDSWAEELGFTKAEFRSAFAKIGKVYKSKKAFLESTDKFEGKYYLSYYDRIKRLTYYVRNEEVLAGVVALEGIVLSHGETTDEQMDKPRQEFSRNLESDVPLSVDYITSPLTDLEKSLESSLNRADETPCEEIVAIYHETCPELVPLTQITPSIRTKLYQLWQAVEGQLETLREVFKQVAASDFLSGRLPHKKFKASFEWLIKGNKYIEILAGKYRNRFNKQTASEPKPSGKFHKIASHNWDFTQLEALEQAYIEKNLKSLESSANPLLSKLRELR